MSINEIYPIWSNVINYLGEYQKINISSLDSFTNDIVNNSFDLSTILGRWRYAHKKLLYLSTNEQQIVPIEPLNRVSLNKVFISNWGVYCSIIVWKDSCYFRVVSLLGCSHYYFIKNYKSSQGQGGSIHSYDTKFVSVCEQSNKLIYHFDESSVMFTILDKFEIVVEHLNHQIHKLIDDKETNADFIDCNVCKTLNKVVNKITNQEFLTVMREWKAEYGGLLHYSLWDGNCLITRHDNWHKFYKFVSLISDKVTIVKYDYLQNNQDSQFFVASFRINFGGFISLVQNCDDRHFFQMLNMKSGQKFELVGRDLVRNCYFIDELNVGFAYGIHNSRNLCILTHLNNMLSLHFKCDIKEITVCPTSLSIIVCTQKKVFKINLRRLLLTQSDVDIDIN